MMLRSGGCYDKSSRGNQLQCNRSQYGSAAVIVVRLISAPCTAITILAHKLLSCLILHSDMIRLLLVLVRLLAAYHSINQPYTALFHFYYGTTKQQYCAK